jgi:hypothetical protein
MCNGRWFNPDKVTVVIRLAEKAEVADRLIQGYKDRGWLGR